MKTIQLFEYVDYKESLPNGFTESTEGEMIANNSYAWNDNYKALRINDASASLKGSLTIKNFANAKIGDVVEFNAEIMNISGVKGKLAIDYDDGVNLVILQTEKTGEFEKIGGKFVIKRNKKISGVIGVFTGDVGDFYIRNIEIKVNTREDAIEPDIRGYNFLFNTNSLSLLGEYNPYKCTATVSSTEVTITHAKPFAGALPGNAIASVSASGSSKIIAKAKSETVNGLKVVFFDMTTGAIVDPATLYGTNTYFSVIHHGYKL